MFVRWKDYKGKLRNYLRAVLVECKRANGLPRQRVVKYLGSIRTDRTADKCYFLHPINPDAWVETSWRTFWQTAAAALESLALPDVARARVDAALNARVPLPTPENLATLRAARDEARRQYAETRTARRT